MKDGERFDDLVSYANGFQVNVPENIKLSKSNGELLTYGVNDLKNYSFYLVIASMFIITILKTLKLFN